jgi:citrate lyase subunit beta/citryl-CoA lyase
MCPSQVSQCHPGEIDLQAELGANHDAGLLLLTRARAELPYASAAAGILPPMAGVYTAFRDLEGFIADSDRLAQLGLAGRPAIHPSQVAVINAAFRPVAAILIPPQGR